MILRALILLVFLNVLSATDDNIDIFVYIHFQTPDTFQIRWNFS